jgi:hypothetical protein
LSARQEAIHRVLDIRRALVSPLTDAALTIEIGAVYHFVGDDMRTFLPDRIATGADHAPTPLVTPAIAQLANCD